MVTENRYFIATVKLLLVPKIVTAYLAENCYKKVLSLPSGNTLRICNGCDHLLEIETLNRLTMVSIQNLAAIQDCDLNFY